MPHKPPLSLCNEDIALLQDVLLYYSKNGGYENNRRAAKTLFDKIADDVPRFPCYVLAWPGVTSEELAPVLSDDSAEFEPAGERNPGGMLQIGYTAEGEVLINLPRDMTGHIAFTPMQAEALAMILQKQARFARLGQNGQECPECANPVEHLRGRVCTSAGCPMVEAGICKGRNGLQEPEALRVLTGCAACDRGDFSMGHADHCSKKSVPDQTGYQQPGPIRTCPVCKGTGDKGNPTRGFVLCNECDGTGEVLSDIPAHVRHMLARLERVEASADKTANEASMRANGIIPD